jgi:NCS1 family nucleobase:cation symporter-1
MSDSKHQLHSVYEGARPTHTGDTTLETQGIAPIPEDSRYGGLLRMFTVWFTPNMEISGIFIGTLAVVFGLGFRLGLVSIILGVILGALPVAILCTWGPKTGTGQLPIARMPFGKSVVLPAAVQWLSSIGWTALTALFGAQAAHLLFHIPFWSGALLVLVLEAIISIYGYELIHRAEWFGAAIMFVLFVVLTTKIFQHHIVLPQNTVHGTALAGAFVLMVTVALSSSLSWASYASDYSRYMKPSSSTRGIFWATMGGLCLSYLWVLIIGLAAASVLSNQTAAGIRTLMGGGAVGDLALATIIFAAIVSCTLTDYSGSLAIQTFGVRVKRPIISVVVMVLAFSAVLWMNAANTSTRFENILLFASYWLAPFFAIVMIDWHYNKRKYTPAFLRSALSFKNLGFSWPAIVSFVVGFAVMVPFMDTSLVVGYFAHKLQGADLAFYVGFIVTGVLYYALRKVAQSQAPVAVSKKAPAN